MRALRAHSLSGSAGLSVDEVPEPTRPTEPGVLIEVHAAGVGFADILVTRGRYQNRQEPPFVPGMEVAGVVRDAPAGSGLAPGQAVCALLVVGGCAELVWAEPAFVAPLASGLTFAQGAAMVVNYHTAWLGLTRRARLVSGETVLVHGAGGGLGSAFVQIATRLGARVSAVAGSPERRAIAAAAGAEVVYGPDDWFDPIRAGGGVDVIVDPVGGDVFDASLRCLAGEGRLLTVGFTAGRIPAAPANRLLLRNSGVLGMAVFELLRVRPELFAESARALDRLVAEGLRPPDPTEFSLDAAPDAFVALEQRRIAGKAVVLIRDAASSVSTGSPLS